MNEQTSTLQQSFAGGAAAPAETATGVTQADAAPEAAKEDLNAEFESLIKGKYKEAYDKRVRDTIQRRLKGAKDGSHATSAAVKANAEKLCASWLQQEQETRAYYPDFDMVAALHDETFRKLLRGGADVRTAFEAANKDRILPAAMSFAYAAAERMVAKRMASAAARPDENGLGATAAVAVRQDVSKLTRSDIADVSRRVARGERVSFG